jgi:predicted ABC-type ATPase
MSAQLWLWLIAGPNGAGKTTYAPNLAADVEEIVRPDELASHLSREAPENVAFQADRLAISRRTELLKQRRSFAVETTLSGRRHLLIVERAKSEGWSVGVVYIGLGSADLAIERVRERVMTQGGHHVRAADVRRRYQRSLENLAAIYQLTDRIVILDNSSSLTPNRMKRVLEVDHARVVFRQSRLPKWLTAALGRRLHRRPKKAD